MGYSVDTRLTGRMIHFSAWAEHPVFLTLYPIASRLCAAPPSFLSSNPDYGTFRVPSKRPKREFKVGDRVTVSLPSGRVVEATVKAVINRTHGVRLQVDYGKDETALVYLWQVRAAGCNQWLGPGIQHSKLRRPVHLDCSVW
jgi:hypothetical protein